MFGATLVKQSLRQSSNATQRTGSSWAKMYEMTKRAKEAAKSPSDKRWERNVTPLVQKNIELQKAGRPEEAMHYYQKSIKAAKQCQEQDAKEAGLTTQNTAKHNSNSWSR